jgi:hypothetical protein
VSSACYALFPALPAYDSGSTPMRFYIAKKRIEIANVIAFPEKIRGKHQQYAMVPEIMHDVPQPRPQVKAGIRLIQRNHLYVLSVIEHHVAASADAEKSLFQLFMRMLPAQDSGVVHQIIDIVDPFYFERYVFMRFGNRKGAVKSVLDFRNGDPSGIADRYFFHIGISLRAREDGYKI